MFRTWIPRRKRVRSDGQSGSGPFGHNSAAKQAERAFAGCDLSLAAPERSQDRRGSGGRLHGWGAWRFSGCQTQDWFSPAHRRRWRPTVLCRHLPLRPTFAAVACRGLGVVCARINARAAACRNQSLIDERESLPDTACIARGPRTAPATEPSIEVWQRNRKKDVASLAPRNSPKDWDRAGVRGLSALGRGRMARC